jgi:acyl-CoA reductase-like NAD-dependent aldehyde dehydrogenase
VGEVFTKAGPIEEVSFTGSTEIGARLYQDCTCELKGCTLELGGKSPALVLPDCDMDETVAGTLFGVYLNQGECCCAATRLIVMWPGTYRNGVLAYAVPEHSHYRTWNDPQVTITVLI